MQATFSFDKHEIFHWDCLNSTGTSDAFKSSSGSFSSRLSSKLLSSYFGSFTKHELENEDMHKMNF